MRILYGVIAALPLLSFANAWAEPRTFTDRDLQRYSSSPSVSGSQNVGTSIPSADPFCLTEPVYEEININGRDIDFTLAFEIRQIRAKNNKLRTDWERRCLSQNERLIRAIERQSR